MLDYKDKTALITGASMGISEVFAKETPEAAVARGLKAFERNKSHVVSGTNNWLLAQTSRFFPRSIVARISKNVMRPGKTSKSVAVKASA